MDAELFTTGLAIGQITDVEVVEGIALAQFNPDTLVSATFDMRTGEQREATVVGYTVTAPMPNCRVYHREFWRTCSCESHAPIPPVNYCLN